MLLLGCSARSRLEPEALLADLEPGAVAQLCRFTSDLVVDVDDPCVPFAPGFDACVAAPPWEQCDPGGRPADVNSWEACVVAANECRADDELCWHVACRP